LKLLRKTGLLANNTSGLEKLLSDINADAGFVIYDKELPTFPAQMPPIYAISRADANAIWPLAFNSTKDVLGSLKSVYYYDCAWYSTYYITLINFVAIWFMLLLIWLVNTYYLNIQYTKLFHKFITILLGVKIITIASHLVLYQN
jgi:hypothetical protein